VCTVGDWKLGRLIPAANNVRYRQRVHRASSPALCLSVCLSVSFSLLLCPSPSPVFPVSVLCLPGRPRVTSIARTWPTRYEHSVTTSDRYIAQFRRFLLPHHHGTRWIQGGIAELDIAGPDSNNPDIDELVSQTCS